MSRRKSRKIKLNDEALQALKNQREYFIEKFGREPGPQDPVFFDPDCDVPTPMTEGKLDKILNDAALKAGLDPARVMKHFFPNG